MSELQNFPFKNQLKQVDLDKLPDVNSHMECLPTSLASALQYLLHKQYEGEELGHAVYGKNYTGGTSAIEYVHYVAAQGVRLYSISGNTAYLVEQVHKHLSLGHPVIGTIPSSYLSPADPFNPGMSHCIVFYKDAPNTLTAMNPWEAFAQCNTDAWWASRFCFGQVWVVEKVATPLNVPTGWKDDGHTLTAPNGHRVVLGFRSHVLSQAWHPDNQPLEEEHNSTQLFAGILLTYNPKDGVRENYLGSKIATLDKQLSDVLVREADEVKKLNNVADELKKVTAVNEEMNTELDAKEKEIAALQLQVQSLSTAQAQQPLPSTVHDMLQTAFNEILAKL